MKSPRGAKTDLIETTVEKFTGKFTLNDVERTCPGVSRDMDRRVLRELQKKTSLNALDEDLVRYGKIGKRVM